MFLSSWLGGFSSGVAATLLSTALVWWSFVPPEKTLVKEDPKQLLVASIFVAMGLAFSVFHERLRRANRATDLLKQVQQAEAKYRKIVDIAADAIISVDEESRILLYNAGAEKVFGWSSDEVVGRPLDLLLPERFRQAHRQHVRAFAAADAASSVMGQGRPAIFGLRKNGEEFPAEAAISKLRVDDAWTLTVILRDITEHKRIEKEERFLAAFGSVLASTLGYEETVAAIARLTARELGDWCALDLVDDDGRVRRVDVASADPAKADIAEGLKGFELDPKHPNLIWAVLQSKQPQILSEIPPETIRAVAHSEEHRRVIERASGRSAIAVPLMARDRLLGALVSVSSRPERRLGEADLGFLGAIAQRAALALDKARIYERLQRTIQQRDEMLGIVAHDLRNPLATIIMLASVLERPGIDPKRPPEELAATISHAATRMNRLIQDLLDVTRMEAGRLSIQKARVPAAEVVSESVAAQQQLASRASLEVRLEVARDLAEVWADRDRLLQAFENLIGNAVKFTEPGGRITVGAASREGDVLFWVVDTGLGIAAENLPHLFDRFWQAGRADRLGAGLGLPIVKGIVEAHGGRIWVESTPGQGTSFFFTIPAAPKAEEWRQSPLAAG